MSAVTEQRRKRLVVRYSLYRSARHELLTVADAPSDIRRSGHAAGEVEIRGEDLKRAPA